MTSSPIAIEDLIEPLQLPGGGFGMVALDQRESLREMYVSAGHGPTVPDSVLREFKREAVQILSPHASGVLLDRPLSVTHVRPEGIIEPCGLILAADVLKQEMGGPVESTELDDLVTPAFIQSVGAVAIKLLVIWRASDSVEMRNRLVSRFVDVAREAGVASLVEGIVKPPTDAPWSSHSHRHKAIIDAAVELSAYGGTIYKAEVPGYVPGDLSLVLDESARMSDVVSGPWVVLSNGVRQGDFAEAVRSACLGGADGFLAGRAIWSDTVGEADQRGALATRSVQRLTNLIEIVESARTQSRAERETR
jgi:sulfofructosephosphate aldolase